jgi:hypothetical protein
MCANLLIDKDRFDHMGFFQSVAELYARYSGGRSNNFMLGKGVEYFLVSFSDGQLIQRNGNGHDVYRPDEHEGTIIESKSKKKLTHDMDTTHKTVSFGIQNGKPPIYVKKCDYFILVDAGKNSIYQAPAEAVIKNQFVSGGDVWSFCYEEDLTAIYENVVITKKHYTKSNFADQIFKEIAEKNKSLK